MTRLLRYLFWLLLLCPGLTFAAGTYQTFGTLPDTAISGFRTDGPAYWRDEDAARSLRQLPASVYSGGLGATSGTLSHTIPAVNAMGMDGHAILVDADTHLYTASRRTYLFLDTLNSRSPEITASGGSGCTFQSRSGAPGTREVFIECAAASIQPILSVALLPLFYADTSGTAITLVRDLRPMSPIGADLGLAVVSRYASSGDGTSQSPWQGWDTRIDWGKGNQVVWFGSGTYRFTAPIAVTGMRTHVACAGKQTTVIYFEPTVDAPTYAGVVNQGAFHFATGENSVLYQSSIRGCSLLSTDATLRKVGVHLVDVSEFHMADMTIGLSGTWTGNTSRGIIIQGREISVIERSDVNGDIPIQISDNPNSTLDIDHFTFRDNYTIVSTATGIYPSILVDSGVNLSNVTVDGLSAVNGSGAFRWIDTTSVVTSFNLVLKNIRFEQGTVATSYIVDIQLNTSNPARQVLLENISGGTGASYRGYIVKQVQGLRLSNVAYTGSAEALNVDSTVLGLTLDNCYWLEGATSSITGQTVLWSVRNNTLSQTIPTSAVYTPTTLGNSPIVVAGQTMWQSAGTLANGAQSTNLFPFGQTFTMATVLVSARGATLRVGGHVLVYTGPAAYLIAGSANFNVGNVVGSFTVFTSGASVLLFNQLGEAADYIVTVFRNP